MSRLHPEVAKAYGTESNCLRYREVAFGVGFFGVEFFGVANSLRPTRPPCYDARPRSWVSDRMFVAECEVCELWLCDSARCASVSPLVILAL